MFVLQEFVLKVPELPSLHDYMADADKRAKSCDGTGNTMGLGRSSRLAVSGNLEQPEHYATATSVLHAMQRRVAAAITVVVVLGFAQTGFIVQVT